MTGRVRSELTAGGGSVVVGAGGETGLRGDEPNALYPRGDGLREC